MHMQEGQGGLQLAPGADGADKDSADGEDEEHAAATPAPREQFEMPSQLKQHVVMVGSQPVCCIETSIHLSLPPQAHV